jgi:tRNA threonylcarbamoyladenosine biosynthesis protein TsaB
MKHTGIDKEQLSAIAVSSGPGSYTGLRIGTSFAKGMCFSLDIPLIAIDTLIGMASGINPYNASNALLCPMIDARRMEVYCLVVDPAMNIVMQTEAVVINEDSFRDLLEKNEILFFGNGASKCESLLGSNKNAKFIDSFKISAADIGQLATKKFEKKEFVDVAYFEPHYLKEYIAGKPKSMI